ncbi:MAG: HAMP domain-containing sensor histidine kinase [Vicinamibacteria bacterium]
MKDEFLASMSHELRTPLNAILGLSEALQENVYGALQPRQREALQTVEESGRHLLELINDILDLSKIEAGKVVLELSDVPLGAACAGALRLVLGAAQAKHVSLESSVVPEDAEASADPRRLKQILVNLLSNAVKFTPEGGRAGVEARLDGEGWVRIVVWDTGIGIAAEDVARLFQPFTQLDSSLSRQHAGTGLGLALVRRLAELHGGAATLESEPGKGTRVTVRLPAAARGAPRSPPALRREPCAGCSLSRTRPRPRPDPPLHGRDGPRRRRARPRPPRPPGRGRAAARRRPPRPAPAGRPRLRRSSSR